MKKLLVSALALGAMSSMALAQPAKLSDHQMDKIAAGDFSIVAQNSVAISHATCVACVGIARARTGGFFSIQPTAAAAGNEVSSSATSVNVAIVHQ